MSSEPPNMNRIKFSAPPLPSRAHFQHSLPGLVAIVMIPVTLPGIVEVYLKAGSSCQQCYNIHQGDFIMTTAASGAGTPRKTYVAQGKIKIEVGTPGRLTITPTTDYCVKRNTNVYTVFVQDHDPPACKCFKDTHGFTFPPTLESYLVQAAFAQAPLQITIDDSNAIVSIQVPA
jgi:hypothetical protein